MSEDDQPPTPNEKAPEPKLPKKPVPKQNPTSRYNKKNTGFVSPKAGTSSRKGAAFKGGGVKKGK